MKKHTLLSILLFFMIATLFVGWLEHRASNFVGAVPTEQYVKENVVVGMSEDEVIAKVGNPSFRGDPKDGMDELYYTFPSNIPSEFKEQHHIYVGFQVVLQEKKVVKLNFTYASTHQ
jgi:outer membrane protein assembly factor BamE (lipoprotein component of BamABCDE complex)